MTARQGKSLPGKKPELLAVAIAVGLVMLLAIACSPAGAPAVEGPPAPEAAERATLAATAAPTATQGSALAAIGAMGPTPTPLSDECPSHEERAWFLWRSSEREGLEKLMNRLAALARAAAADPQVSFDDAWQRERDVVRWHAGRVMQSATSSVPPLLEQLEVDHARLVGEFQQAVELYVQGTSPLDEDLIRQSLEHLETVEAILDGFPKDPSELCP